MKAFSVSIESFSSLSTHDIDALIYGETSSINEHHGWQSWDACLYDCIIKSKELFAKVEDPQAPLVWLLPALAYQDELKQLLANSLKRLYPEHVSHLLFYGATGGSALIALVQKNAWHKVNVIALDATFKANKQGEFSYQGVAGILAVVTAKKVGWVQTSHYLAPSIDFIKHDQLSGMFVKTAQTAQQAIEVIFAPGNGIEPESDVWLNNLQLLDQVINEHTHYELPNYKLGKMGALEGIVNLYQLTTSPAIVERYTHALVISQEQAKYQATASYLWISEEVHNNAK